MNVTFFSGFFLGMLVLKIYEIVDGIIKYRKMTIKDRQELDKLLERYKNAK